MLIFSLFPSASQQVVLFYMWLSPERTITYLHMCLGSAIYNHVLVHIQIRLVLLIHKLCYVSFASSQFNMLPKQASHRSSTELPIRTLSHLEINCAGKLNTDY